MAAYIVNAGGLGLNALGLDVKQIGCRVRVQAHVEAGVHFINIKANGNV